MIIRARVRAYDAVTHTADIEPISAPEALMDNVPCLQSIPATDLVVGNTVAVLMWGDVGGLVLGAQGSTPTSVPSPHDILGAHHSITGGAALDLVGQTATNTLGRITPNAAPGETSAILKTDTSGHLRLDQLTTITHLITEGDIRIDNALNHDGPTIGFFGTTPVMKTTVSDFAAWVDVPSSIDHIDLAALNVKLKSFRDKIDELVEALQWYGLG